MISMISMDLNAKEQCKASRPSPAAKVVWLLLGVAALGASVGVKLACGCETSLAQQACYAAKASYAAASDTCMPYRGPCTDDHELKSSFILHS
jgi:hypothetical protein